LQRQVKAAEKYRELKETAHLLRGQLLALRWQGFEQSLTQAEQNIVLFNEELENNQQRLVGVQEDLTHKRQTQSQWYIDFNEIQAKFYANQAEIDKLDHQIGHIQQRQEELEWDLEQTESALSTNENTLEKDRDQLENIDSEIYLAENQLEELAIRSEQAQLDFEKTQQTFQSMEVSWEVLNRKLAETARQVEVEKTHIQNLDRHLQQNNSRLQRLENESQAVDIDVLEQELQELNERLFELEDLLNNQQHILESFQQEIVQQRQENQLITKEIHEKQSLLQQAKGKLASLETLQESTLGKDNPDISQWLQQMGLSQNTPRLVEMLQVENGWEKALETVLEHYLQALCVNDFNEF
jgi:chromosome segregation protein